ncbi:MAG: EamA/RhaT family transporter [Desulfuromonas sp.]|nr:MAG: EamA/RhaT family transporter [Desulfuromonas sp.]
MKLPNHIKGLLLTVIAVLILSPDATLVKLIRTDGWTLLFWRCLLTAITQAVLLGIVYRGQFRQSFSNIGRAGLLSALIIVVGSLLFVHSILQTTAANTLIILAATPLFSSLLSRLFLAETLPRRTWIAIAVCFGGILLIFSGSLAQGLLWGDLLALGATLMWAGNLVVLRHGKAVNMIPANLLGNLLVAPVALLAGATPLAISSADLGYLVLLGGLLLPVSFSLITLSPRYIPAPEISLILLIETVLGPVWVWLILGEIPVPATIVAGLLILATLLLHTYLSLRARSERKPEIDTPRTE